MLQFQNDGREFESFQYQRPSRIMVFRLCVGVSCFGGLSELDDVSVFRIGDYFGGWWLTARAVQTNCFRLKNAEHQNEKQKDERTVKAIFTFDKAMFMSGDLGGKKQHPWRLLRALFVQP